jgi:6-phosphogluconolactonase/glucosamine-6-phosphate isomerase/deaminase
LLRNSGRVYLAASGEGKHQLAEELKKSVPGSEKTNISLMRNSGRVYLAASGEGKHQLAEEFGRSVPGSERRRQISTC